MPVLIAGLVVGALFAAAIAAGIPQYGRTLEMITMRASVENVQPFDTNLHVISQRSPLSAPDSRREDEAVFSAVEDHLGEDEPSGVQEGPLHQGHALEALR